MSAGKNSTVLLRTARHCRYEQVSAEWYAPIASAAALIERPVQEHSNEEGTGAPQQGSTAVRTVCFCFHYDGSRKNVNKIFKKSSAERVEKIRQKTRRQLHWTKQIAGILRHIPYRNEMCRRE